MSEETNGVNDATKIKSVDLVAQTKKELLVSFSQLLRTNTQQAALFGQQTMKNLSDNGADGKCYEILEHNLDGMKKISETNKKVFEDSLDVFNKIKTLIEE